MCPFADMIWYGNHRRSWEIFLGFILPLPNLLGPEGPKWEVPGTLQGCPQC